ncbi:MAG: hypothetical protein CTR53_05370 [Ferrovibrio sp.]|nr:MAG: hypothetical protein CTR53_05370 [Ferrovibrio sp.]
MAWQVEPAENDGRHAAGFMHKALGDLGGIAPGDSRVLDFGCGGGELVERLCAMGWDVFGCDMGEYWLESKELAAGRCAVIQPTPYRLPFPDQHFDIVISTSVLEHALNKEEVFREIFRVLRPGGSMLHLLPGKWYLPTEPHIFVPLVSWLWPYVPQWWLSMWAILGVRNSFQAGLDWRETANRNRRYMDQRLSYWTRRSLRRTVEHIFGNCSFPDRYLVDWADGGLARLARRLPFRDVSAWISGNFRMGLLFARRP